MSPRCFLFAATAIAGAALLTAPFSPAAAWTSGSSFGTSMGHSGYSMPSGPSCKNMNVGKSVKVYKPTRITNNVNIYKPVTVNKDINVYKPTTINKNINVYKPVTIDKNIDITKNIDDSKNISIDKTINDNKNININKNIDASKNININKSIVINKGGGGDVEAAAFAAAMASAGASASVNNSVVYYGGGYYEDVTVNNRGGDVSVHTEAQCRMQEASVVKAIHAMCVSPDGQEFPASHMVADTWVESSYEGEILRCIPGAHLKVTIGDVLQSNQGMAGTYQSGQVLECGADEALDHYKNGMLKCVRKKPVPDCTERTNLRRYGTGDMFFSYRSMVCVSTESTASAASESDGRDLDVTGMTLEGGVGGGD